MITSTTAILRVVWSKREQTYATDPESNSEKHSPSAVPSSFGKAQSSLGVILNVARIEAIKMRTLLCAWYLPGQALVCTSD